MINWLVALLGRSADLKTLTCYFPKHSRLLFIDCVRAWLLGLKLVFIQIIKEEIA
jgi:hypothetical protein